MRIDGMGRDFWFLVTVFSFVVLFDQILKLLALRSLEAGQSLTLIDGALWITLTRNTGAAFSVFSGNNLLLAVITAFVVAGILSWVALGEAADATEKTLLLVLAGGAVGNLIDRLLRGGVVDYLDLGWWPVFNLADVAISVSIVILVGRELLRSFRSHAEQ